MRFSPLAFLLASAGLTSAKQQEQCPPKPQPIRHIKFTDSNAGGLHNYELHGNARIVEPAPYPVGRALRIDQMYSYALLKDLDISPSKTRDVTLSIDVYIESIKPNSNGWVLGHDNGGWDRAIFLHDPRFNGMGFTAGFRPERLPQWTPPPIGKWMQIVGVWRQRGYCELYVDKLKVKHIDWCNNSDGLPDLSIGSLQDPSFGAINDNDVWIKEVQVYDKALSAAELDALECDFQANLEPSIDCGYGGPLVTSCTDCASGGDPSGCGGDCVFDGTIPICKDVDPSEPLVNCGAFQASSCAACGLTSGGASACAGDCKFDVASGTCVDEDYVPPPSIDCGNGALVSSCSQCASGGDSTGCGGDCVFDGTTCKDVDPSTPLVNCGAAQATSCAVCTAPSGGASGCAGDCKFDVASGTCVDEDYVPPTPPTPPARPTDNGGTCPTGVSCGGHRVDKCSSCPMGHGAAWCNGECMWDAPSGKCVHQSENVNCGGHRADSCSVCPSGRGAAWCNGECMWDGPSCKCVHQSDNVNCGGHRADSCYDCPNGNNAAWCNGECTWNFSSNSCVKK